jgi:RNase P protein component
VSLSSWLKRIVRTIVQEEDQKNNDTHIVVFLARKSYEDNNLTIKRVGR